MMNLMKNILRVILSNLIMLTSSVVLGLILPIFLNVEDYGYYRLFLFYVGYVGVLHFGFNDALYIKYGGVNHSSINRQILRKEHRTFVKYQLLISILILVIALILKNIYIILFAIIIIPVNTGSFHKLFYQATGQFKRYSAITIFYTIINLILIGLLLVFKIYNPIYYILVTIVAYLIVFIKMEYDFMVFTKGVKTEGKVNIINYNKIGIFILIGNLCVLFISSTGSWFVQFFMSMKDFAIYSFAVSMMNMILLVVNAIGLTFYNYIAKKEEEDKLILVKESLLVIGTLAGSLYFILKFIVTLFLPEYKQALSIIAISFMTFPYIMIINVIVINLYKARKNERRYLKVVVSILFMGIVASMLIFSMLKSMTALAAATLLTYIVWYIFSTSFEFKYLKGAINEPIYLAIHIIIFIITANNLSWYIGLLVYSISMLILSILFNRKYFVNIFNIVIESFKQTTKSS